MNITIGTRGSKLALWQAQFISDKLIGAGIITEIKVIKTTGDKILNVAMSKVGSKGIFTEELEHALVKGEIDIAVHSAKDMPSELPEEFELIAFSERERVNDVVVTHQKNFNWEKEGMVLGTSSTRRKALLKHYYPHIATIDIRGNLQTRIRKMEEGQCDGLILDFAGVHRMNYDKLIYKELDFREFVPAVGQGSIVIECHADLNEEKRSNIRNVINHRLTEISILTERSFLKRLQGGCSIPAFAYANLDGEMLYIEGGIISLDGSSLIKLEMSDIPENALTLGNKLGATVLSNGGEEILSEIRNQN